jgi:hypothetical protein
MGPEKKKTSRRTTAKSSFFPMGQLFPYMIWTGRKIDTEARLRRGSSYHSFR